MWYRKLFSYSVMAIFMATTLFGGFTPATAQAAKAPAATQSSRTMVNDEIGASASQGTGQMRTTTNAMRIAAATRLAKTKQGTDLNFAGIDTSTASLSTLAKAKTNGNAGNPLATMNPQGKPDYFADPNFANSPLPQLDPTTGAVVTGTGMRKFVDTLPGICGVGVTNDLGQCIPLAVADTTTFANSDYYEIALVEYKEQLHADLPLAGTQLRGYVQIATGTVPGSFALTYPDGITPILNGNGVQVMAVTKPSYLGPIIHAVRNRPVRVKFTNYLPTSNKGGALFVPTDTSYMGAGMGPGGSIKEIDLTNTGAGYANVPTVVISAPPAGGTQAVATANIINGSVVSFNITNGGAGYLAAPTVTLNGPSTTHATAVSVLDGNIGDTYSQNRATLHLHGGNTPWISDGTQHQWTTPKGELTSYSRGDSVSFVPDMWFDANGNVVAACAGLLTCATGTNDPGAGSLTFYWTNQESGRLMFYHDHAYGITRVNVYAGEAAGYLLTDPVQEDALAAATVPGNFGTAPDLAHIIPLVIQDKSFVPDNGVTGGQLANSDPTWDTTAWGGLGNLWFPHVYTPNQNPYDNSGANAYGRWDYGPWFFPPQNPTSLDFPPVSCLSVAYPGATLTCPGTPNPSGTPEGFMDTPVINGTAYPTTTVDPTAYRFQMLMAGNDRTWNLGLYVADPLTIAVTSGGSGFTAAPTVVITPANGAVATASISAPGSVASIVVTGVGSGYASAPSVTINGNGTGATATSTFDAITGTVTGINVVNPGAGYTIATATIAAPLAGTTATATVNLTVGGSVTAVTVTTPPTTPFTTAPAITFSGTGTGAAAIASINTEIKMVDAVPHTAASTLAPCAAANPTGGAMLVSALLDGAGNPLNGTGLLANCWPSSWPADGRDGGVPDPTTAGPPMIQIGTEGGLLPAPVVIPSTPVGFEYNRRSITVLNIFQHGLLLGPAERADVVVDFSQFAGKTLILYNDAPAPVPAFDPRSDYYTGDPDQTTSGGAPSTLPGYGPNTRTIMQIVVNAVAANPLPTTPFSLAALAAAQPGIFTTTQDQMLVSEPSFPVGNGNAATPTYVRISDTQIAAWASSPVGSLTLTNGGAGYSAAPSVAITGGGGTGATASLTFTGAFVNGLTLNNGGAGYSSRPTVTFTGGGGAGAVATAIFSGSVTGLTLGAGGTGYATMPAVSFTGGGGGTGATGTAKGSVNAIALNASGNGYTSAPTVTLSAPPAGGVQATATAAINAATRRIISFTITNPGSGYTAAPTVTITGGGGNGGRGTATLRVSTLTLGAGGSNYATTPAVAFTGGGGTGATATATLTGLVTGLLLTNGGAGYTSAPTVGFTGGGAPTSVATATASFMPGAVASLLLTNGGTGYTSAPTIVFTPNGAAPTTPATATASPAITQLLPKTIQELFTADYGRMNATLGVEVPFTNFLTQTTIPYGSVDPPTELFKDGEVQIWKITHNGVDTHFIHFHLYTVQVLNRVGWDGAIKPPDPNEVAWKDTVRMNPLEDVIVALKPMKQNLPWAIPNSIRRMDVTRPIGASIPNEFTNVDPTNEPAVVTNQVINFGWEYVWHCHILGHEENDMMRTQVMAVQPPAPTNLTAATAVPATTRTVTLTFQDNAINETGYTIMRSADKGVNWAAVATIPVVPGIGTIVTYRDRNVARRTAYQYQVVANNMVGYTEVYAAPVVGYPHFSYDSAPSNIVSVTTNNSNSTLVFANGFQAGLLGWAGSVGNVQFVPAAAMGPNPAVGAQGMAAVLAAGAAALAPTSAIPQAAYVYDTSPTNAASYDANFWFNPNGTTSDNPVDIFLGLDQAFTPTFGIQYQGNDDPATASYAIRGWMMSNGDQVYTQWITITNAAHQIELSWASTASGGLSLYVDDGFAVTLAGSSNATLSEVLLGPSNGLTSGTSGTMYFDEFVSTQANGVVFNVSYMPIINQP